MKEGERETSWDDRHVDAYWAAEEAGETSASSKERIHTKYENFGFPHCRWTLRGPGVYHRTYTWDIVNGKIALIPVQGENIWKGRETDTGAD